MRIGVSSYSFVRLLRGGQLRFMEMIARARELGFEAIEFSGLMPPEGESARTFAPKVREACAEAGLSIACYTVGADFLNGSGGDWAKEAERVRGEVDIAALLGAPCMRHDATRGWPADRRAPRGFDDALPILAKGCRAVTEYAADKGIRTTVENHGFFCQDSARVERLINAVAHPNFGALIDIGNFLCADEDPVQAVGRLAPYAFHVHAKDFHTKPGWAPDPGEGWFQSRAGNYLRGAIIGHGAVPVAQCLRVLRKARYDGVCSVEFEGMEDPLKGIAIGLANLRRYLAAAAGG